tara:strand:- start:3776 stop:4720 length:945 start_codon:yes stop_codon:yes gene_type:complete
MRILVTGAAGYVGSVVCHKLMTRDQNYHVIAVDRNLCKHGWFDEAHEGNYNDIQHLLLDIDCVVHCAATSLVGPSIKDPKKYYRNNVYGTQELLDACVAQGVKRFVFISSAACYGNPENGICKIDDSNTPINPYGWSKRMTEIMLADYHRAYGLNSVSLRLFNVAGAHNKLGQEKEATHIIARIMESAMAGKTFTLYGDDFDTDDGTCVRDYVHVYDVAGAVHNAIKRTSRTSTCDIFNIGNGSGYSNMDIIKAIEQNTDLTVNYEIGPRREGDPDYLVADTYLTQQRMIWQPSLSLDDIVDSAYKFYKMTSSS